MIIAVSALVSINANAELIVNKIAIIIFIDNFIFFPILKILINLHILELCHSLVLDLV